MPGPTDPNKAREQTPAERVQADIQRLDDHAHARNTQPHDPDERIFFVSKIGDVPVEVHLDYEHSHEYDHSAQTRLQIVYPHKSAEETETYLFNPINPMQTVAHGTPIGSHTVGVEATKWMADRLDEVLIEADSTQFTFLDNNQ